MAAKMLERLFSLELLVDWLRLEAGVLTSPASAVEKEEEVTPLRPVVAFRLLDFPTLLVYPPSSPVPKLRPGVIRFGRGKSCLFRLHPATLHRLLLRTPLSALVLQVPPGCPPAAPRLLGSCGVSLGAAVRKVLEPTASARSQGHRGSYPLYSPGGERVGDIALGFRLTDLDCCPCSWPERLFNAEVSSPDVRHEQPAQLSAGPSSGVGIRQPAVLATPEAQKDFEEVVFHSAGSQKSAPFVNMVAIQSVVRCSSAGGRWGSSQPQDELDMETNTFCPPPLYYMQSTPEKTCPAPGKTSFAPRAQAPEERHGVFQEENLVIPPAHPSPVKCVNTTTDENPSVLVTQPAHTKDVGESNPTISHPQSEHNRVNMVRQLPLLNALLIELSLLCNQPLAGPTHVHPHLAWLDRTEDSAPDSEVKSMCKSESKKEKFASVKKEKSLSPQYRKNKFESSKRGMHFEKNSYIPQKQAPKERLLYGITNTLKLRLKQTNPDMLVVHEKREQYRKTQAQMLSTKIGLPSKVNVLSFTEHQKSHQLSEGQCLDLDTSFAENGNTLRQINGGFDDPSTTKTTLSCATEEKTVDYSENRICSSSLEEIRGAKSITSDKLNHINFLETKVHPKVQSQCVLQQDVIIDKIVVGKEGDDRQIKTTDADILGADVSENELSISTCSENISELKYSDDFTSLGYSEDFSIMNDTSRRLRAHDSSPENQYAEKSSGARSSVQKNSSGKSSILSPPFSAGSPVHSCKRFHTSKTLYKSFEEASSMSTSDFSSHWILEKENQMGKTSMPKSEVIKRNQDISIRFKTKTSSKSSEKSQSPRTSQMSSYLPSNFLELKLNTLESSTPDQFEEDSDEIGSLNISKQCKDICELVINKLPGYTM
ncbi:microtubule-associated protein 10 [Rhynchocyon petersi]